jgi:hypothetical protein
MSVNTSSIGTGKDYATITLWEAFADYNLVAATTKEIGQIQTNENFDEHVIFADGTYDGTYYPLLTVHPDNRHAGVEGTGHARMYPSSSGHLLQIDKTYVVVQYLDLCVTASAAASDECVRIGQYAGKFLISKCILHQSGSDGSVDGVYASRNNDVYVDNCIGYYFQRFALHPQQWESSAYTQNWYIDYCSLIHNNRDQIGSAGNLYPNANHSGTVINMNVYNTFAAEPQGVTPLNFNKTGSGTVNWAGSNVLADDATAESKFTASQDDVDLVDVEPSSGENIYANELTHGDPEDYRIKGENAYTETQNGISRIGSEPANSVGTDSPQDFSTDIAGRLRTGAPSFTIGAYQFALAAAAVLGKTFNNSFNKKFNKSFN